MDSMGNAYLGLGLYSEAQPLLQQAAETRRRLSRGARRVAASLGSLGVLATRQGRYEDASRCSSRASSSTRSCSSRATPRSLRRSPPSPSSTGRAAASTSRCRWSAAPRRSSGRPGSRLPPQRSGSRRPPGWSRSRGHWTCHPTSGRSSLLHPSQAWRWRLARAGSLCSTSTPGWRRWWCRSRPARSCFRCSTTDGGRARRPAAAGAVPLRRRPASTRSGAARQRHRGESIALSRSGRRLVRAGRGNLRVFDAEQEPPRLLCELRAGDRPAGWR